MSFFHAEVGLGCAIGLTGAGGFAILRVVTG